MMKKKSGNALQRWREEKGFSIRDAALLVDKSAPTWWRWEKGITMPNRDDIKKIRLLTGVTANQLYGQKEAI